MFGLPRGNHVLIVLLLLTPNMVFSQSSVDSNIETLLASSHPIPLLMASGNTDIIGIVDDMGMNQSTYLAAITSKLFFPDKDSLVTYPKHAGLNAGLIGLLRLLDTPESLSEIENAYFEVAFAVEILGNKLDSLSAVGASRREQRAFHLARGSATQLLNAILGELGFNASPSVISNLYARIHGANFMAQAGMKELLADVTDLELTKRVIPFSVGWNLRGVPLNPLVAAYDSILVKTPLSSVPYSWDGEKYIDEEFLTAGKSYWMYVDEGSGLNDAFGTSVESLQLDLHQGWNMVSGPSCDLLTANVIDPNNIVIPGSFQKYDNGYQADSLLKMGVGYWVHANSSGQIDLDCNSTSNTSASTGFSVPANLAETVISDASGGNQTLYFGGNVAAETIISFLMPPIPPRGEFDVRFSNDSRLAESMLNDIRLQARQLPVIIELTKRMSGIQENLVIEELALGQVISTQPFILNSPLEISNTEVSVLRIRPE